MEHQRLHRTDDKFFEVVVELSSKTRKLKPITTRVKVYAPNVTAAKTAAVRVYASHPIWSHVVVKKVVAV